MYTKSYLDELTNYSHKFDFTFLENKTICLSGGTGLIGSFLVDLILSHKELNCKMLLLVRNKDRASKRFSYFKDDSRLEFKECDLTKEVVIEENINYVLHLASLTDPYNYAHHPIEIMNTNFIGTKNLLDLAKEKKAKFFLSSTCEVYGQNDKTLMKENDYGYIDILDPRACYNESKKASETLCACYKKEHDMDIVIARLSRVYGPTMKLEDTKALSQFLMKALNKEDIVLKSKGEQKFNYTYVGDVAISILLLLKNNHEHMAYNVTNMELRSLKEIAEHLAKMANRKVVFELPSESEKAGYSKAQVSSLDASMFIAEFKYSIDTNLFDGLAKTLTILKENIAKNN